MQEEKKINQVKVVSLKRLMKLTMSDDQEKNPKK